MEQGQSSSPRTIPTECMALGSEQDDEQVDTHLSYVAEEVEERSHANCCSAWKDDRANALELS